jgi:predicted nucleic acid-binding protein
VKRLLLDVNVVLDLVLGRAPFLAAAGLWGEAEKGRVEILLPAHGVTTIHYLAARERGRSFAAGVVERLLIVPGIAAVDAQVFRRALALGWADFEDAVCAAAAERSGCDLLVTRDPSGYRNSPVPAVDAATALALVASGSDAGETHERPPRAYGRRPNPRPATGSRARTASGSRSRSRGTPSR